MFDFPEDRNWEVQIEALKSFLIKWYGNFVENDGLPKAKLKLSKYHLPPPLVALYQFVGQRKEVISFQNQLLNPDELDLQGPLLVFYVENQGVYLWAARIDGENPQVVGKFNQEREEWQAEEELLATFLYELCLFEAVMGAPYGASASSCSKDELEAILKYWTPIPYGAWRWPAYPTRFYAINGALLVVMPNYDEYTIVCGARKKENLDFMKQFVNKGWDHCNFVEQEITLLIIANTTTINKLKHLLSPETGITIVDFTTSGEDGIQKAIDLEPDIILVDYYLPWHSSDFIDLPTGKLFSPLEAAIPTYEETEHLLRPWRHNMIATCLRISHQTASNIIIIPAFSFFADEVEELGRVKIIKDFIAKPLNKEEVVETIQRVHHQFLK